MREYEVRAEKLKYGDDRIEKILGSFNLKIKRVKTRNEDDESLIYEVESQKKLTIEEQKQIQTMGGIFLIKEV